MNTQGDDLVDKINRLREVFRSQLPERIDAILSLKIQIDKEPENVTVLRDFHKAIHSLVGAGGTFGYQQLSDQACILEEIINTLIYENKHPTKQDLENISTRITELKDLSISNPDTLFSANESKDIMPSVSTMKIHDNLIYVLDEDRDIADELVEKLNLFSYEVAAFDTVASAQEAINKRRPFVIILDLSMPEGHILKSGLFDNIAVLTESSIPLYFISERTDWEARLVCVRAGSTEYITRPVDFNKLIDKLDVLASSLYEEPCRVLIVEDVEVLAQHYALVLRRAGHEVTAVTDVRHLFESLTRQKADLILMDLYMPDCTGIESAKMIRQIDDYVDVPIVFLSMESEIAEQLKALRIGGDEFLHKPIRDDHLIAAVTIRARRFKHLRSLMTKDSLTGLINHVTLNYELEREISRAIREKSEMAFIMLDIDHFKEVNDQYGHQVGDRVLKSLARSLIQHLRKSDIVARYGGEEFSLILPGTSCKEAFGHIDRIRTEFSKQDQSYDNGSFKVSFSAGISSCPAHTMLEDIVKAADRCLYQAKAQGRNCVVSECNNSETDQSQK